MRTFSGRKRGQPYLEGDRKVEGISKFGVRLPVPAYRQAGTGRECSPVKFDQHFTGQGLRNGKKLNQR